MARTTTDAFDLSLSGPNSCAIAGVQMKSPNNKLVMKDLAVTGRDAKARPIQINPRPDSVPAIEYFSTGRIPPCVEPLSTHR